MLGVSLCSLYNNKYEVHAFHRDDECFSSCHSDFSLDLTNLTQLQILFSQIKPDLVIHCASLTSIDGCENEPELAHKYNVIITENISRICSDEVKLIYISTDQVYGKVDDHSENNTILKPVNEYGRTKLKGEQKVQEFSSDHIIIRTNIFGWNAKPGKVSSAEWMYHSLSNREELILFTDYTFSPIYTDYFGEILMQLVDMDFIGVVNLGSPTSCSKYEFGIQIADAFKFGRSLIKKGSMKEEGLFAKRCPKLDLDCNLITKLVRNIPDWRQSISMFAEKIK